MALCFLAGGLAYAGFSEANLGPPPQSVAAPKVQPTSVSENEPDPVLPPVGPIFPRLHEGVPWSPSSEEHQRLTATTDRGARPAAMSAPDVSAQRPPRPIRPRAIDGDTFEMPDGERIRLPNIDTPEMGDRANCPRERALAVDATRAARQALAQGSQIDIIRTGRTDRFGRTLASIRIDGQDLGTTLIAQGVAQPWRGRRAEWCSN